MSLTLKTVIKENDPHVFHQIQKSFCSLHTKDNPTYQDSSKSTFVNVLRTFFKIMKSNCLFYLDLKWK